MVKIKESIMVKLKVKELVMVMVKTKESIMVMFQIKEPPNLRIDAPKEVLLHLRQVQRF